MGRVNRVAIDYAMFLNPFATSWGKTAQINSLWYEEIARINPAQANSDPLRVYISEVNDSSQGLFSSQTLCIRLSQQLHARVRQCHIGTSSQSTQLTDCDLSPTQIQQMVTLVFAKDRFPCPTNLCKVSSKLISCVFIVMTINSKVQVSSFSD
jgi:hypothetical protein